MQHRGPLAPRPRDGGDCAPPGLLLLPATRPPRSGGGAPASRARGVGATGPEVAGRQPGRGSAPPPKRPRAARGSGSASAAAGRTRGRRRAAAARGRGGLRHRLRRGFESLRLPAASPKTSRLAFPSVHAPRAAALRGKVVGFCASGVQGRARPPLRLLRRHLLRPGLAFDATAATLTAGGRAPDPDRVGKRAREGERNTHRAGSAAPGEGAAAPPGGRSSAAEGRAALRVGQAKLGPWEQRPVGKAHSSFIPGELRYGLQFDGFKASGTEWLINIE